METYHFGLVMIAGVAALAPCLAKLSPATRMLLTAPVERLAATLPD